MLLGPEASAFDDVVRKWASRREFIQNLVSKNAIRDRLRRGVVDILNCPSQIDDIANAIIDRLIEPMKCDIILPMSGIDLRDASLLLSDDIRATFLDDFSFDSIVVRGYENATHGASMAQDLRSALLQRSVLIIRAQGDENSALWSAQVQADVAVDCLQFRAALFVSAPG
jgi:hypothetical protein